MKIGFTYDIKTDWIPRPGDPVDINAEFDLPEVVDHVVGALEAAGHQVKRIGNAERLLAEIDRLDVDVVLNICEGYHGRTRESQVPALLEMKQIPVIGSDSLTLGLTLDKVTAKRCFLAEGIPTARFFEARHANDINENHGLRYPLFVKPRYEGTSKGLTNDSKVDTMDALRRQVAFITETYKQPALVEEFIAGQEFTVALIGNDEEADPLPVVQIAINGQTDLGEEFYTFERVVNEKSSVKYICPADIPDELAGQMQAIALKVYRCVECRDFGRVDFRVDSQGHPYVLEINPLPSLSPEDAYFFVAKALGISYQEIINRIINAGLKRHGLPSPDLKEAVR